jgi:hypothetical protein
MSYYPSREGKRRTYTNNVSVTPRASHLQPSTCPNLPIIEVEQPTDNLGLDDINDIRNGLLLSVLIHRAFGLAKIAFLPVCYSNTLF